MDERLDERVAKTEQAVAVIQNDLTYIRDAVGTDHTTVLAEVKRINGTISDLVLWRAQVKAILAAIGFVVAVFGATLLAFGLAFVR